MDIGSQAGWPAGRLSNFAPHLFIFRNVPCSSMEGLLQSLKHKSPEMQTEVCKLVGKAAKFKGKKKKWWRTQTLWWQGQPINRHSKEFQELLDEAFWCLFSQNEGARRALLATGNSTLTHSMGKSNPSETVLTEREFCSRLMQIRARLKASNS